MRKLMLSLLVILLMAAPRLLAGEYQPEAKAFEKAFAAGDRAMSSGDMAAATIAFQKAVDVSTTAVGKGNALNMLGWIAFQKAEYAKAKALYLQAIASDPDQYWAHNSLGACLVKEGDLAGAVAEFQKSVEVNSKASDSEAEARVAKAQKNLDEVQ